MIEKWNIIKIVEQDQCTAVFSFHPPNECVIKACTAQSESFILILNWALFFIKQCIADCIKVLIGFERKGKVSEMTAEILLITVYEWGNG